MFNMYTNCTTMKKISILLIAFYTLNVTNGSLFAEDMVYPEDSICVDSGDSIFKHSLHYPYSGNVTIVEHFGERKIPDLQETNIINKGVVFIIEKESTVQAVHDGIVSAVFVLDNKYNVIIRHGEYLSVYSGMNSVSVKKGQMVLKLQSLGTVGTNQFLYFQWRKGTQALNPEDWFLEHRDR